MNILSLFDGMSCGQIALKQLGIIPEVYYASEIDKHAIKQTQLNFPNTIQLGDVTRVDVSQLETVDLLIGGSPCQSFSFAGKRVGMSTTDKEEIYTLDRYLELKEEGFQFEGESYLFWEYMRILTDIRQYNPNVLFLLENVEMGKKWERVLSEAIGVYGVHINSTLVSAQNRKRIYWTNIRTKRNGLFGELHSDIPQPVDKGVLLKDILEDEVDDKFYLSDKMVSCLASRKKTETFSPCKFEPFEFPFAVKGRTINQRVHKMGDADNYVKISRDGKIKKDQNKASCFTAGAHSGGNHSDMDLIFINKRHESNYKSADQKANALLATSWKGSQSNGMTLTGIARIRRLTPTECARLQTIPDWYKWECSDTQQYRMLGNGWTVDVIAHILSFMKEKLNINVA
jgi:DNA (cytosine-5)-methyltransferase 3A